MTHMTVKVFLPSCLDVSDDNDGNDDKIADNDNDDDDGDDDDLEEENCVKAVALARFHSTEAPCGALSASTHLLLQ